tara:strand:- start:217 stop:549 length:333 start_codon:yes stop_codon:yes gene_type:complete
MKIVKKPWGHEIIIENNKKYLFKKLYMNKGSRCSLQYHKFKIETIYVLSGLLEIQINNKFYKLGKGESLTIKNKVKHRMKALKNNTFYLECSSPFPNDVIRLEDDYKRVH